MATPLLPNFSGDPNSARDILDYLVDPANAGLIDLDTRLTALTAATALKVEHSFAEAPPTSSSAGWLWTKPSIGTSYYCHTAYTVGEPAPDTKWTAITDNGAVSMVKALSQIASPTPQVSLLSQTISGFGSDSSISVAEKATVKILYDEMVKRKIEIDLNAVRYGITGATVYTNYTTSYATLIAYVATTGVLTNLNVATIITSSTDWTTNWTDTITKEGLVITEIREQAQDLLDTIDGNTDSVLAQLADMTADGTISASEKLKYREEWNRIQGEYTRLSAQATEFGRTGQTAWTTLAATYAALTLYLGTTTTVFSDMATSTILADEGTNATEWQLKWQTYYVDAKIFDGHIDTYFRGLITAQEATLQGFIDDLAALASDGVISGGTEKQETKRIWDDIVRMHNQILYQGAKYSVATPTGYTTAYSSLSTYLNTTLSLFSNMSTDTTVVRSTFNANFDAFYTAYDTFTDLIVDAQKDEVDLANVNIASIQADLDAQDATIQSLSTSLQALGDDAVISGGTEKQTAKRLWDDIVRLHDKVLYQAVKYSVATPANYTAAYNALNTYFNTTLNLFNNMETDTAIVRSVFNSTLNDYYFNYDAFTDLIVDAQKVATNAAPADYEDYKALIDSVVDDGIVSAGMEKTRFNAIWLDIQATQAIIVAKATNAGATTTALVSAYNTLSTYIGTLTKPGGGSANFTIESEDTAIGISTFHGYMRAYEAAKAQLESDIISKLIELQAGNARTILDMNDDGIISVSEKGSLYKDWLKETAEKSQLDAQATLLSITTEKTNMDSAYTTLETFLNGLQGGDGLFDDLTIATTLTTPQKDAWDGHWNLFFTTKATLQTTIIATVQGNTAALGTSAFRKDGTVAATGNFDMADYSLNNIISKTLASGSKWAATNGQLYTEQQARLVHEGLSVAHSVAGSIVGTTDAQTLTTKTINADSNTISNLEADNLKAGVIETAVMASTTVDNSTVPSTLATKTAITTHQNLTAAHGATGAVVGTTNEQTLTTKTISSANNTITIDADTATVSNIETDNFKAGVIVTTVGATGTDTAIPTEQAVREAIAAIPAAPVVTTISNQTFATGISNTTNSMTLTLAATGIGADGKIFHFHSFWSGWTTIGTIRIVSSTLFEIAIGNPHGFSSGSIAVNAETVTTRATDSATFDYNHYFFVSSWAADSITFTFKTYQNGTSASAGKMFLVRSVN